MYACMYVTLCTYVCSFSCLLPAAQLHGSECSVVHSSNPFCREPPINGQMGAQASKCCELTLRIPDDACLPDHLPGGPKKGSIARAI